MGHEMNDTGYSGFADASQDALGNYGRDMIYYSVVNRPADVVTILNSNGVVVQKNVDTKKLHFIALKSMTESTNIKNEMADLLYHVATGNKGPFSATKRKSQSPRYHATTVISTTTTRHRASNSFDGISSDLDCGVKGDAPYSSFADGTTDSTKEADTLTFKDLLGKSLDLAIVYMATQGNKGVSKEVNNAEAVAKAKAAAEEKSRQQRRSFQIFAGVLILGALGFAAYKYSQKK